MRRLLLLACLALAACGEPGASGPPQPPDAEECGKLHEGFYCVDANRSNPCDRLRDCIARGM